MLYDRVEEIFATPTVIEQLKATIQAASSNPQTQQEMTLEVLTRAFHPEQKNTVDLDQALSETEVQLESLTRLFDQELKTALANFENQNYLRKIKRLLTQSKKLAATLKKYKTSWLPPEFHHSVAALEYSAASLPVFLFFGFALRPALAGVLVQSENLLIFSHLLPLYLITVLATSLREIKLMKEKQVPFVTNPEVTILAQAMSPELASLAIRGTKASAVVATTIAAELTAQQTGLTVASTLATANILYSLGMLVVLENPGLSLIKRLKG